VRVVRHQRRPHRIEIARDDQRQSHIEEVFEPRLDRLWAVQYGPVTDSVRQLLEAHALAHGVLILTGAEELEHSGQLPPRRAGSG